MLKRRLEIEGNIDNHLESLPFKSAKTSCHKRDKSLYWESQFFINSKDDVDMKFNLTRDENSAKIQNVAYPAEIIEEDQFCVRSGPFAEISASGCM